MAFKYTEDQLNKMDKALLIELFLGLQDQMEELTKETHALKPEDAASYGTGGSGKTSSFWKIYRTYGEYDTDSFMEIDGNDRIF